MALYREKFPQTTLSKGFSSCYMQTKVAFEMTTEDIFHDDVIKWKFFSRNWPFVWGIHRSPVTSPHKGQWRGALMFSFLFWIHDCVNNREAGDLRHYRAHYGIIVMCFMFLFACHVGPGTCPKCDWHHRPPREVLSVGHQRVSVNPVEEYIDSQGVKKSVMKLKSMA